MTLMNSLLSGCGSFKIQETQSDSCVMHNSKSSWYIRQKHSHDCQLFNPSRNLIDPLHEWRLDLTNHTLSILSLVLIFPSKGVFPRMWGLRCISTVIQIKAPLCHPDKLTYSVNLACLLTAKIMTCSLTYRSKGLFTEQEVFIRFFKAMKQTIGWAV